LYAVFTWPLGRLVVVIDSAAWTTKLSDLLAVNGVASESADETVKLNVPLCAGVPARTPALLKVMPVGKVPEARLHLYGL
jgi:hypothetical protein